MVLEALSEPLRQVDLKGLSFKTSLLMGLVSTKRVGDILVMLVNPTCMQFSRGDSRVCFYI